MSAEQRRPKQRSFISQFLCCLSPTVENEQAGTNKTSTAAQEKTTKQSGDVSQQRQAQRPQTASNTETQIAPTTQATAPVDNEKSTLADIAAQNDNGQTDATISTTAAVDSDATKQTQQAQVPEVQPALTRDDEGVKTTIDVLGVTTSKDPVNTDGGISEEKQALLEDEPLSPSSAVITATEPIAETTQPGPLPVVSNEEDEVVWLLPKLAPSLKGRKCLVLDLDETLVHSSFKVIHQADFVVPVEIDGIYHNVYVIKRPGVDDFMLEMGKHFEIVVFTASLAKYADPVLDILDIHKVVHHRLFRESCHNHQGNYVKDLSQLGRELKDAIIIDNSPASYVFHPAHAVPISSWFNDVHDTELTDLIPFLIDLTTVEDISQILELSI